MMRHVSGLVMARVAFNQCPKISGALFMAFYALLIVLSRHLPLAKSECMSPRKGKRDMSRGMSFATLVEQSVFAFYQGR